MFELKIKTHFAAAHQLTMVSQKCENLHGHNWKIEVSVAGDHLDDAGVLIDFGVLKKYLAEVINSLDHKFLNELKCFGSQPSSERIAVHIAEALQQRLDGVQLRVSRVSAWESENNCASYIPG